MTVNVDHKRKLIFVHIQKTAGRSIKKLFGLTPITKSSHQTPTYMVHKDIWESYFSFCVVRHPIDRLLSSYFYHTKESYNGGLNKYFDKNATLKQYFSSLNRSIAIRPQYLYTYHQHSTKPIDYIARFENLRETLQPILDMYDINGKIPHLNSTPRNMEKIGNITNKDLSLFIKYYRTDFKKFNYNNDLNYIKKVYF